MLRRTGRRGGARKDCQNSYFMNKANVVLRARTERGREQRGEYRSKGLERERKENLSDQAEYLRQSRLRKEEPMSLIELREEQQKREVEKITEKALTSRF